MNLQNQIITKKLEQSQEALINNQPEEAMWHYYQALQIAIITTKNELPTTINHQYKKLINGKTLLLATHTQHAHIINQFYTTYQNTPQTTPENEQLYQHGTIGISGDELQ